MLYFLTGDIQTGKTRWLEQTIARLNEQGVICAGVIAPGIWQKQGDTYKKLGIENVLLPQQERFVFGMRRECASSQTDAKTSDSQSSKAKLGWDIPDASIEKVNAHFDSLQQEAANGEIKTPRLLVIDELGQLELLHEGGLTSAVKMLKAGPTASYPHALVIVRSWLLDAAIDLFSPIWPEYCTILPDEQGFEALS
ncbi:MAG: hypothetical protein IKE43_13255 [Coriobacteriales bacterium]|nr:hypothetical protein [Coriobacteriales bacterium]